MAVPAAKNVSSGSFGSENVAPVITRTTDEPIDGVLHGYTYTDDVQSESKVVRKYDSRELSPQIESVYCAPSGHMFYLTIDDETLDEIFDQIDLINPDYYYMNICYNYGVRGIEMYLDSNGKWCEDGDNDYRREWMKNTFKNDVMGRQILKVDEVQIPADLYVRTEIQIYDLDDHGVDDWGWTITRVWEINFYSKVVEIKPYGENDYIGARIRYYQEDEYEKRINIDALMIPGFFNEMDWERTGVEYNEYGWLTKTTTVYPYETRPDGSPHYFCDYTVSLVAFETITIGYLENGGIELTYPTSPIEAKLKLEFVDNHDDKHVYYSEPFIIGDPDIRISIDGPQHRTSIQQYSEHNFCINFDIINRDHISGFSIDASATIDRLYEDGTNVFYCYNDEPLPETGSKGVYYYYPSAREKQLHAEGRDEEFLGDPSEGEYYTWWQDENLEDGDDSHFALVSDYDLFSVSYPDTEMLNIDELMGETIPEEALDNVLNQRVSIPCISRFAGYYLHVIMAFDNGGYAYIERRVQGQFEVTYASKTENIIIIDNSDNINLLADAGDIDITPTLSAQSEDVDYYFDYEVNKEGIIDVVQDLDGKLSIHPSHSGVVELTIGVESSEFSRITKTVTIRVLDSIYDVAKIEVPDEFHYANKDLTVGISIRGFKDVQNIDIEWKVKNKAGEELPAEKMVVHKNASMTILNPDSDDYTITAFYDGIELSNVTVQVRYVDVNSFLRVNIWWIVAITIGFVAFILVFTSILKRGKTTVEHIERVYQVFCKCYSDDKLTVSELNNIKREITKCLHRCEDLNIDAFNQYEKATRYLRKSLADTKSLIKEYDHLSPEERSVLSERLDKDLAKALNVAKEIETAKDLIESYHMKANRSNYEKITEDKKSK